MTTNHLEKLDEALIRPGYVDLQVAITNATHYQAQEIFKRMYSNNPLCETAPVLHKQKNPAPQPPNAPEVKKPATLVDNYGFLHTHLICTPFLVFVRRVGVIECTRMENSETRLHNIIKSKGVHLRLVAEVLKPPPQCLHLFAKTH
jgi:hypothetical protein